MTEARPVDTTSWTVDQTSFYDKLVGFMIKVALVWAGMLDKRFVVRGKDVLFSHSVIQNRMWACYLVLVKKNLFDASDVFLHNCAVEFAFGDLLKPKRSIFDQVISLHDPEFKKAVEANIDVSSSELIVPTESPQAK